MKLGATLDPLTTDRIRCYNNGHPYGIKLVELESSKILLSKGEGFFKMLCRLYCQTSTRLEP